jgi:hypothetical protein
MYYSHSEIMTHSEIDSLRLRERVFHLSVAPALSKFHSLLNISRRLVDLTSFRKETAQKPVRSFKRRSSQIVILSLFHINPAVFCTTVYESVTILDNINISVK